ncbi:MAG: hypothetical protein K9M97_04290 [Akkermansiaceae bacterium]|nr:hypothetical protein [Akkermansiaceae bacterium]
MFLRHTKRWKDGKQHLYWSMVENRRCQAGRILQKTVLYLGEITYLDNGSLGFVVEGGSHPLSPGHLSITRPWQPHSVGDPDLARTRFAHHCRKLTNLSPMEYLQRQHSENIPDTLILRAGDEVLECDEPGFLPAGFNTGDGFDKRRQKRAEIPIIEHFKGRNDRGADHAVVILEKGFHHQVELSAIHAIERFGEEADRLAFSGIG